MTQTPTRMICTVVVGAAALGLTAACGGSEKALEPREKPYTGQEGMTSGASQAPVGEGGPAMASAHGVTVKVVGDAWDGNPENLETEVVPLYVSIENNTAEPIVVRYRNMMLQLGEGEQHAALPPFQIEGEVGEPTSAKRAMDKMVPRFEHFRFHVSPNFAPRYEEVTYWMEPLGDDDPMFYRTNYGRWQLPLPTVDMIEQAMPEGVLSPGGRVAGFIYFDAQEVQAGELAALLLELVHLDEDQPFGTIELPLTVRTDTT